MIQKIFYIYKLVCENKFYIHCDDLIVGTYYYLGTNNIAKFANSEREAIQFIKKMYPKIKKSPYELKYYLDS